MAQLVEVRPSVPDFVNDTDDFLATHSWVAEEDNQPRFRPPNTNELWPLPLRDKASHQIQFWLKRLERLWDGIDRHENRALSKSTHDRLGPEAIARTFRTMQGLKGLLFPDDQNVPAAIAKCCDNWRKSHPALADALDWQTEKEEEEEQVQSLVNRVLQGSFQNSKQGWSASLVLMLIRAAAWSQVKWEDQPYLWEAHSTLWTKQEHVKKATLSETELAILTFLIRYQSAPGQWSRTTGDKRFLDAGDRLGNQLETTEQIYRSSFLPVKDLRELLGILAHAQEFRNWTLEDDVPPQLRRLYQYGGYLGSDSNPTDFRSFWDLGLSLQQPVSARQKKRGRGFTQRYTWSYIQSLLDDDSQAVNNFRRIAEKSVLRDIKKVNQSDRSHERIPIRQITTFALDRESLSLRQLRDALMDHIRGVNSEEEFRRYFKWKPERVPTDSGSGPRRGDKYEYAIVVRLKDHITAKHMVFTKTPVDPLENRVSSGRPAQEYCRQMFNNRDNVQSIWSGMTKGELAGVSKSNGKQLRQGLFRAITGLHGKKLSKAELGCRTYEYLFGRKLSAKSKVPKGESTAWDIYESLFLTGILSGFITWTGGGADNYCPTHLIHRFLKVSYRLRGSCIELPLEIDGQRIALTLPRPPEGVDRKAPAVRAIARYVCAFQINKMMATPATDLKVGLKNLESTPAGRFWRHAVSVEFQENYYDKLLGAYVDNFHRHARYVEPNRELLPRAGFLTTRTSRPDMMLRDLLEGPYAEKPSVEGPRADKRLLVVGGIDIGSTSIKFGFYQLQFENGILKPLPWLEPTTPNGPLRSRDFKIQTGIGNDQYADANEFCERILIELERRLKATHASLDEIAALGIAWPGPVREGVVRDWSGILRHFSSHRDPDSPRGTELTELLSLDICGSLSKKLAERDLSEIAVIMMNDGESHAVGELTKLATKGLSPDLATQIVLKAGSGIAGAVATRGELLAGLMEFGKVLVNLAYSPSGQYPNGLATAYFSGRTLPMLALEALPHLSELDPPLTSLEIGLLAELADDAGSPITSDMKESTCRLLMECGKIAFARQLREQIDAAELTDLLTNDGWMEHSQLRQTIEMHLGAFGSDARREFLQQIACYGRIRMEAILRLETELHDDFVRMFPIDSASDDQQQPPACDPSQLKRVLAPIRDCANVAQNCVERLGEFLADLIVLIFDEYQMDRALVAGGVLSDKTRETVLRSAQRRLGRFCSIPHTRVDETIIRFSPEYHETQTLASSQVETNDDDSGRSEDFAGLDSGTLGSAIQAALERLKQIRLEGLRQLHALVYTLTFNQELIVEDRQMSAVAVAEETMDKEALTGKLIFDQFALNHAQIREYLDNNLNELGIVRLPETQKDRAESRGRYGRWLSS